MTEVIRRARPGDETELTAMIHELAEFEHAGQECTVTESQLGEALFGEQPTVYGHIAEVDGEAAAGALWFQQLLHLGRRGRRLPRGPLRAPAVPQARTGQKDAGDAGPRMRRRRLHAAVVGGAGLERQRHRPLRRRRRTSRRTSGSPTGCQAPSCRHWPTSPELPASAFGTPGDHRRVVNVRGLMLLPQLRCHVVRVDDQAAISACRRRDRPGDRSQTRQQSATMSRAGGR